MQVDWFDCQNLKSVLMLCRAGLRSAQSLLRDWPSSGRAIHAVGFGRGLGLVTNISGQLPVVSESSK